MTESIHLPFAPPSPEVVAHRYRTLEPLGRGGMGAVYLAEDLWRAGRRVAIKTAEQGGGAARGLEREFGWLSGLRHPNVVAVHDFGACEDSRLLFYTMEHAEGAPLHEACAGLPFEQQAELLVQLCRALEYVHSRGLVHRDVKSDNVVVRAAGVERGRLATLVDFGLAAPRGSTDEHVLAFSGTLTHGAPEVLAGESASTGSDLYALGVTAYQVFAGRLPFDRDDPLALVEAHRMEEPPKLATLRPDLPAAVATAVHRLLAKDPAARPGSALEFAETLTRAAPGVALESLDSLLAHARAPAMVGQEAAREALSGLIDRCADPRAEGPRSLLVRGPAGTGKSRLLAEARAKAQVRRLVVLQGSGSGSTEPFAAFREPLRDALRRLGASSPLVVERLPELVKVDPDLARTAGAVPSAPLPLEDERLRIARATWDVLSAVASRPVLLLLDDVHEMSVEAAWLTTYLARAVSLAHERGRAVSLTLLAAGRREPGEQGDPSQHVAVEAPEPGGARSLEELADRIETRPLDEVETETLLSAMLVGLREPRALAAVVHSAVGGSAHLVEQWVAQLLRRGAIARDPRGWSAHLSDDAFGSPPSSMLEALAAELEAQAPDLRETLVDLALLAALTPASTVASLRGWPLAELDGRLDALERLGRVVAPSREEGRFASPASALVRDAALRDPSASERAATMLEAADRLGLLADADRAALAERAGDLVRAAGLFGRALDAASSAGDAFRAVELAQRLSRVTSGAPRRRALRRLALALLQADRRAEAEEAMTSALGDGPGEPGEDAEQAEVEAKVMHARGQHARATERAAAWLQALPAGSAEHVEAELLHARLLSRGGDPRADAEIARLVESGGDAHTRGRRLLLLGAHGLRHQHPEAARVALEEAARCLSGDLSSEGEAACENNLGVALLRESRLSSASRHLERAVRLRERAGARGAMAGSLVNLSLLDLELGRLGAAKRHAEAALEVKEEVGDLQGQALCHVNLASAALLRDDLRVAASELARGLELARATGDDWVHVGVLLSLLEADIQAGDVERAEARRATVAAALEGVPGSYPRHRLALAVSGATCKLLRGQREAALAAARLAAVAAPEELPREQAECWLLVAEIACDAARLWRSPLQPPEALDAAAGEQALEAARKAFDALEPMGVPMVRARLAMAAAAATAAGAGPLPAAVEQHLDLARATRGVPRGLRMEVEAAGAWTAARRGRLTEAEDGYARAVDLVRAGVRQVPREDRATWLADFRRAGLRQALLDVRQAKLTAQAKSSFFSVIESEDRSPSDREKADALALGRATAQARSEAARLREVIEITRGITTLMPVRDLLVRVLESAMKFIHAERGFIVLAEGDRLEFAVSRDRHGREVPQAGFSVSRSVLKEVVRTKQPVLTSDARSDVRFVSKESVLHLDLHSVLVAPLVAGQNVLGAIYVDSPRAAGVFNERDLRLLVLFAQQAAVAVDNARLHSTRLEKERLDQELEIARGIQQGLLPRELPGTAAFKVAAAMEPARDIGGDYYDFIALPDGGLRLAIGDVSGKGVPAGLFMVMARTILRSVGMDAASLDVVLARANDLLHGQIEDDKFMTMLLLEPASDGSAIRACLAGHEPPLLYRRRDGSIEHLPAQGIALGIFPGIGHHLSEVRLDTQPGDVLTCYSDGVTECRSPEGALFGKERLVASIRASARDGAQAVLDRVRHDLAAFRKDAERSDDVTLLVLEAS